MAKNKAQDPTEGTPFEAVIGLEVHVQLKTATKMFCRCRNQFGADPNSLVCPVCLGLPGALPVINRKAVEYTVRVGLACGCDIPEFTKFDRKNYYYPDLPKNYQISQYDLPLCEHGAIEIDLDGERRRIRLTRIHLEEDAGKNIHVDGEPESWVDLNRTGVPLMEIVSEPDIRTPQEAGEYMRILRLIMLYLGVSDCNMEEGSLRCDSNVSIRPRGSDKLETRTEIKNLNSFTNVENALTHEIQRQIRVRSGGGEIVQETRLFDPDRGETRSMRGKEEADDYRYLPDPDLAPLKIDPAWLESRRAELPELPLARQDRFQKEASLSPYHAGVLIQDNEVADFFEDCVANGSSPQEAANWVVNTVLAEMNARGIRVGEVGVTPARLAELIQAVEAGKVSHQKAKDVFRALLASDRSVDETIESLGLAQISDDSVIRDALRQVFADNPKALDDARSGKKQTVNFLVGRVMRLTKGRANPGLVAKLIGEEVAKAGDAP